MDKDNIEETEKTESDTENLDFEETDNEVTDNKEDKKKSRSPMNPIQRFFLSALIVVILIWLLFFVFIGVVKAPNTDMQPKIYQSDVLFYYRLANKITSGDVVVYNNEGRTLIGRIVAIGGDTVEITDQNTVVVNGYTISENDIFYSTPMIEGFVDYPLELAQDEYFILSDARRNTEDSRFFGPVKRSDISGVVFTVFRRNHI